MSARRPLVAVLLLLAGARSRSALEGWLSRRALPQAWLGALAAPAVAAALPTDGIKFLADDMTFTFDLPPGWVGTTPPERERSSEGHLIAVNAQRRDGAAGVQAIVDGGFRGRRYGSSIRDLGQLEAVAQELVKEVLLADDSAALAGVISSERTAFRGTTYYTVRYQVSNRPAIAKLTVLQQRLYCLKVITSKTAPATFFDEDSPLRDEMEAIVDSYGVVPVNAPCVDASDQGRVPDAGVCKVLRP